MGKWGFGLTIALRIVGKRIIAESLIEPTSVMGSRLLVTPDFLE